MSTKTFSMDWKIWKKLKKSHLVLKSFSKRHPLCTVILEINLLYYFIYLYLAKYWYGIYLLLKYQNNFNAIILLLRYLMVNVTWLVWPFDYWTGIQMATEHWTLLVLVFRCYLSIRPSDDQIALDHLNTRSTLPD